MTFVTDLLEKRQRVARDKKGHPEGWPNVSKPIATTDNERQGRF